MPRVLWECAVCHKANSVARVRACGWCGTKRERNRLEGMQIRLVTLGNGEIGVHAQPWCERGALMEYWHELTLPLSALTAEERDYVALFSLPPEVYLG